jgi:hypothetical protein
LKRRVNKQYVSWWVENKRIPGYEGHHLLESFGKKWCDLLMCNVSSALHNRIHYHKEQIDDLERNEMIVESIENIFDYVEYLQDLIKFKQKRDEIKEPRSTSN